MTHTKEPWVNTQATKTKSFVRNSDNELIAMFGTEDYPNRAVVCVNAMAGISNPEAWVEAAKRVQELAVKSGFPTELAEALLDMKEAEG